MSFENTVEKGEIARNEQFLLFQQFFTRFESILSLSSNFKLSSSNRFELGRVLNLASAKGLIYFTEVMKVSNQELRYHPLDTLSKPAHGFKLKKDMKYCNFPVILAQDT